MFHPDALILSDKFSFLLQSFPIYKLKNHYKYKENNVGYKWYISKTHQNENISGDLKEKAKGMIVLGKVTLNTGLTVRKPTDLYLSPSENSDENHWR